MSAAAAPTSPGSTEIQTVPVFRETLWQVFIAQKPSSVLYQFRLFSLIDGERVIYTITLPDLNEAKECARHLIDQTSAKVCGTFWGTSTRFEAGTEAAISFHFDSKSSVTSFKNFCVVSGFLEEDGFSLKEGEPEAPLDVTFVNRAEEKDKLDAPKFFDLLSRISNKFAVIFTKNRPFRQLECNKAIRFELVLLAKSLLISHSNRTSPSVFIRTPSQQNLLDLVE